LKERDLNEKIEKKEIAIREREGKRKQDCLHNTIN
jgi:hypothetical protein